MLFPSNRVNPDRPSASLVLSSFFPVKLLLMSLKVTYPLFVVSKLLNAFSIKLALLASEEVAPATHWENTLASNWLLYFPKALSLVS